MKLLLLIVLGFMVFEPAVGSTETCYDKSEHCNSTNYQTYVECVRKRQKRSTDCDFPCNNGNCIDTCSNCDCSSCNYSNCQTTCNSCCSTCCSNYIPCRTNHCCHKTCHAQCDDTQCRTACRRNCFETVKSTNEVLVRESSAADVRNENKHNVTTIIHLNNVINNTNIIDVPITLNNTNEQNITLLSPQMQRSNSSSEKCCVVIGPRQCEMNPKPRCFHYRSKQCGEFCTASIVHKEQRQVCEILYPGGPPNCRQEIFYIPQPQPRCTYQSVWPYVSCGLQPPASCEGCYDHYTNTGSSNYMNCPPQCYDEGYNIGPMYRQGPIYRPTYSHVPCYNCFGYPDPYSGYPGYVANSIYGGIGGMPPFAPMGQAYPSVGQVYPSIGQPPPYVYQPDPNENISNDQILSSNSTEIRFKSFEPQISGFQDAYGGPMFNPYENMKEVEIDVEVETPSPAQAQVKIKNEDEKKKKIKKAEDSSSKKKGTS